MIARRCNICLTNWPDLPDYAVCPKPECEHEDTRRCRDVKPLGRKEAKSLKSRYEFEQFYEKWDDERPEARLDPKSDPICRSFTYEGFLASHADSKFDILLEPEVA